MVPKANVTIMQMQKTLSGKEFSQEIVSANQDLLVQGAIVVSWDFTIIHLVNLAPAPWPGP